jgi:hypothetical protein
MTKKLELKELEYDIDSFVDEWYKEKNIRFMEMLNDKILHNKINEICYVENESKVEEDHDDYYDLILLTDSWEAIPVPVIRQAIGEEQMKLLVLNIIETMERSEWDSESYQRRENKWLTLQWEELANNQFNIHPDFKDEAMDIWEKMQKFHSKYYMHECMIKDEKLEGLTHEDAKLIAETMPNGFRDVDLMYIQFASKEQIEEAIALQKDIYSPRWRNGEYYAQETRGQIGQNILGDIVFGYNINYFDDYNHITKSEKVECKFDSTKKQIIYIMNFDQCEGEEMETYMNQIYIYYPEKSL